MTYVTSIERSGIEKGLREGLLEGIGAALAAKFQSAGNRLMPRVREISDVEELRALLRAIPRASSVQKIRDRLPAREE